MSRALTAIKCVRALIVSGTSMRSEQVFFDSVQQSVAYPYVLLSIISRETSPTQDSGSALDTFRIQVDSYVKATTSVSSFEGAQSLDEEIRTAISRITDTTTYTHDIDSIQEDNSFSDFIPEIEVARVSTDYMVRVK